jgi:hypothetical protein
MFFIPFAVSRACGTTKERDLKPFVMVRRRHEHITG